MLVFALSQSSNPQGPTRPQLVSETFVGERERERETSTFKKNEWREKSAKIGSRFLHFN